MAGDHVGSTNESIRVVCPTRLPTGCSSLLHLLPGVAPFDGDLSANYGNQLASVGLCGCPDLRSRLFDLRVTTGKIGRLSGKLQPTCSTSISFLSVSLLPEPFSPRRSINPDQRRYARLTD